MRGQIMKQFLIFLLIIATIFACGGNHQSTSGSTSTTDSAEEINGEKIYKTYCVTCHGLYGDMGASGAYNLQESELSLEERIQVVTNGRNAMTGFKSLLSKEKIKAVAAYTFELEE